MISVRYTRFRQLMPLSDFTLTAVSLSDFTFTFVVVVVVVVVVFSTINMTHQSVANSMD